MSAPDMAPELALQAMRREFDAAFAEAPHAATKVQHAMLAIRAGDTAYALRLDQVAGLHADRRLMAMPTPLPALLGVTVFRGRIMPVYDLAALLGHAPAEAPRWLLVVRCAQPLALAFDLFETHFSVLPEQILAADAGAAHRATVRTEADARPLIDLFSLQDDIRRQADLALQHRSARS